MKNVSFSKDILQVTNSLSEWFWWENEWSFKDLSKEYKVRKLNIGGLPVR